MLHTGHCSRELLPSVSCIRALLAQVCIRAAIVGHSLDVSTDIYRFPGATIDSLTNRLDQRDFWNKTYDIVILCVGGNDLARDDVDQVFDKLCTLTRKILPTTKILTFCTV